MTEGYPRTFATPLAGAPAAEEIPLAGPSGSQPIPPARTGTSATTQTPIPSSAPDEQESTASVAKEQVAEVNQSAVEAGQQLAGTAKEQAGEVVAHTGRQAKELLEQARTELGEQAGAQQQRLAAGIRALADELLSMTQRSESPGLATELASQAASKSRDVAGWLDEREPGRLVEDVKVFARQRPGTFLLLALGAGIVAGRLTRGVKDGSSDPDRPSSDDAPTSVQAGMSDELVPDVAPLGSVQGGAEGFPTSGVPR